MINIVLEIKAREYIKINGGTVTVEKMKSNCG